MNEAWLKEHKYMILRVFSHSVEGDLLGGRKGIVQDGDFDFAIYNIGEGTRVYVPDPTLALPLASISVEEESSKECFLEALEGTRMIIGYDVAKFDLPLIENALEVKTDCMVKDLLMVATDATQSHYGNKTERIPLRQLYKSNAKKVDLAFFSAYLANYYARLRDWRKGGTRSVLKSTLYDVELIGSIAHSIYKSNLIKFADKESNKTVSMVHDFKELGLSAANSPSHKIL